MMGKLILFLLLTVAVLLAVVLAYQGDIRLGSSVTLPCQDSRYRNIPSELLDIQWWTGELLVTRFQLGRIIQGSRYANRTYLSAEGLRNGDFSLTITHTEYSDSGHYRCVLTNHGQEMTLREVDLKVKVPRSQSTLFVKSGQRVTVPCYGRVDWSGSEAAFVQWKRWTQVVLQWKSGSLYVDSMFEGRVSVPKERILHGDISLHFNNTRPDDQGYYVCFFKKNDDIRPATVINLTITEQMSRINKTNGSYFQLPLPDESPVTLSFLPNGENRTVFVCEVMQHRLTCTKHYCNRTQLQNNSLILRNITSADSGTFFLRDKGTSRTRNVLIVQIFAVGSVKVTFDGPLNTLAAVAVGVGLLIVLVFSVLYGCILRKRQDKFPELEMETNMESKAEKGSEMEPLQSIEVISYEGSIECSKSAVV